MTGPNGMRVLVVDEDPVARELHAQFLRMAGYDPALASTGAQALMLLRERPARLDWLIARVELSGLIDAFILADEFHAAHPARPALLVGRADARCSRSEFVCLRHPARPDEVVAALAALTLRQGAASVDSSPMPLVGAVPGVPPAPLRPHARTRLARAVA